MVDHTPPPPDDALDDELDELEALRALGRRLGVDADHPLEALEPPPHGIFDRIAAEVADTPAAPATVVPIDRRAGRGGRAPRWLLPAAVAAAAAVVAVVAGSVVVGGDDADEPAVVATAVLGPLGTATGSGRAELLDADGRLQLRVETDPLDAGDGFLEVWVIDTAVEQLVSLGPVRADGLYELPPGLDPRAFPIVDVSVEPIDGDPTHSGDSVLRGQLEPS